MKKKRKPVLGWRKNKIGWWSLRLGKAVVQIDFYGEASIFSDARRNSEREDAERWALVLLKDAWQRLARKIAEREEQAP